MKVKNLYTLAIISGVAFLSCFIGLAVIVDISSKGVKDRLLLTLMMILCDIFFIIYVFLVYKIASYRCKKPTIGFPKGKELLTTSLGRLAVFVGLFRFFTPQPANEFQAYYIAFGVFLLLIIISFFIRGTKIINLSP